MAGAVAAACPGGDGLPGGRRQGQGRVGGEPAHRETIFAPATAAGRAGLGIIRVSGPASAATALALAGSLPVPRRATLRRLRDPADGSPLDDAVLVWMPGPGSFTGEDVLEIQHHGGTAVVALLLEALGRVPGLRLAEPGEFTKRAFLNGRLDLTEAEGLADLIDAATRAQARQALRQLEGGLGRLYRGWRERLLDALARLEAEIDFGDEGDVPEAMLSGVLPGVEALRAEITAHLADRRGERLRAGLTIAVLGAPNVGKSSLVNLLARREVAIVTPVPGTTRDVLEVALELDGLPVTLLDTAGLRETSDPVEREGVARARRRAAEADLRLGILDATAPDWPSVAGAELVAANKSDLGAEPIAGALPISCLTGAGIDGLLARLAEAARPLLDNGDAPLVTRARHREALGEAVQALDRFRRATGAELALPAEELRLAANAIGRVTGRVSAEEVLDRIFATFCIGK